MGLPFRASNQLDADAKAFASLSGATDVRALSAFAKGIKSLGLWSNLVCWPMRSGQNAGTGTTAYSLGGLESTVSTLVGGPAWTTSGITTGAAAYVTSAYSRTITAANLSFFAGWTGLTPALNQVYCGFGSTASTAPLAQNASMNAGSTNVRSFSRNDANASSTYPASISVNGGTLSDDNTVLVPSSGIVLHTRGWYGTEGATTLNNYTCGGALRTTFGSAGVATYSIYGYFLSKLTQQQATDFYAIYKATLGQGLSMP